MRVVPMMALLVLLGAPVSAQELAPAPARSSFNSGLKLRGDFHFNRSRVSASGIADQGAVGEKADKSENGFGAGLEIVGNHIGVGLYGFTNGKTSGFDSETTPVHVVLEGNYFYPVERLRVAPYAGVHTGMGVYTKDYFSSPTMPKPQDGLKDLGYQVGVRFKPIPVIGLDAQWRRSSRSVAKTQDATLERDQVLVGITLF